MPDEGQGNGGSILSAEPAEIIKAAVATVLVVVVRVFLAVFKLTPTVPESLKGALSADQLTNAIAGALWLAIVLIIFWSKKWRRRRRHVHGATALGKVAIWIAEFESDGKKGEHRTNIVRTLERELGSHVQILRAGIELRVEETGNAADEAIAANHRAQEYLQKYSGDLLIWGQVLLGPPCVIELRFASPAHNGADTNRFNYDQKFMLEGSFGPELGAALAVVAAQQAAPAEEGGRYVAGVLMPIAEKLFKLAMNPPASMGPSDRGLLLNSYARAEQKIGEQRGDSEALKRSLNAFARGLQEYTRERAPLDWATTQNSLGNTLRMLGERENGTERLKEAIAAFRAALQERTCERVPLDWATTQNNLGSALQRLGEKENGTDHLSEAIAAYCAALKECTRGRVPLQWAMTQNNLGSALRILGERESGTERLEKAVTAFRAALQEWTRERVPLDWAITQNNLGNALKILGERENGAEHLGEAVEAYRAALEERTRDRVPLQWAMTQNNLGSALRILGERESGTKYLQDAREAFDGAWKAYQEANMRQYDGYFTKNLKEIDALIASRSAS